MLAVSRTIQWLFDCATPLTPCLGGSEGLREMRVRKMHPDCRLEVMGSMMEAMARHEVVMHEDHGR